MALTLFNTTSLFGKDDKFEFYMNKIHRIIPGNSEEIDILRDMRETVFSDEKDEYKNIKILSRDNIYMYVEFYAYEISDYENEKAKTPIEKLFKYHNMLVIPISDDIFKDSLR